ncbi:MAG: ribosome-associated ATPase/putative transporter RbbA [Myxococcota bacterium]
MSESLATELAKVGHAYGDTQALVDIDLRVQAGSRVALVGPDGVGKSTLLSLVSGVKRLQEGQLRVLGADLARRRDRAKVGTRIAFMPQGLGGNLYGELSVAENLHFFGRLYGHSTPTRNERVTSLTSATGLSPFLDRPVAKLSGGMKQKLGLCCALIHDPDLLILDEPTTGVDPLSRRQFWQLVDRIRAEKPSMTVLVATADMSEAEQFDSVVAIDRGRIVAHGSPRELRQRTNTASLEDAFVALVRPERTPSIGPAHDIKLTNDEPAIVAQGLTRRFGDFVAVDQVSFSIGRGEIFGFLGSNGCGKTTTMKMLTGLLPISEGHATLFGHPVEAADFSLRHRIGFMSQSFSLYGELTVEQNLRLHARLFQLNRDRTEKRIDTLTEQFDLHEHLGHRADELPVGIRQRLSLAVAVIHEPEILILDEPTSGVDPLARNEFWDLLVRLSREKRVTIFVSTHTMSEAMRCDHISLMHAGRVLVSDTPSRIIENKGTESLNDAFLAYIEEIEGDSTQAENQVLTEQARDKRRAGTNEHSGSLRRILAYASVDTKAVLRDPVRLAFAFLGSALLSIIISYGISHDVELIRFSAVDLDHTPESRRYLDQFISSPYFEAVYTGSDIDRLTRGLVANEYSMTIEIEPGFGRTMAKGDPAEVAVWLDGANTSRADTIAGYVNGNHQHFVKAFSHVSSDSSPTMLSDFEPRFRYNPSFETINAMGPSVPAILLLLFPAILMAVSVAREKEIGTVINFYVTPTRRFEFLLGKQLPYLAIGMTNFLILTLLTVLILDVPLKGSIVALTLGAFAYVVASTGYGLLISSITSSQVGAVFAATVLSMVPTMQFSGMIQPVSTLEGAARFIGYLWPTTYYMHLSVGTFTKGLAFDRVAADIVALFAFAPVFFVAAMLRLKKQAK